MLSWQGRVSLHHQGEILLSRTVFPSPVLGLTTTDQVVLVSTYSSSLAATLAKPGYTDCPATFSLVSGLWTSAFALGNLLGPSVAGVIYDQVIVTPHTSYHTPYTSHL